MSALSDADILRIFDLGEGQAPVRQALTLLAYAYPEHPPAQLAALSIGQRDTLLFALREQLFGTILRSYAVCPACQAEVVFTVATTDLRRAAPAKLSGELVSGNARVHFRFPNSHDLERAIASGQAQTAARLLFQSCILRACCNDGSEEEIAPAELPASTWEQLAEELSRGDPQADVDLELHCAACQHVWLVDFDIASFLWKELEVKSRRFLKEIDALARVYGWTESEILGLSPRRRQRYLEFVAS